MRERSRKLRPLTALTAIAALLLPLTLAACHDEIPVYEGQVVQGPDTEQAQVLVAEFVPASYFSYSISEAPNQGRGLHIRYQVPVVGALWNGISLEVSCGAWTQISLGNFPWQAASSGTVTFSVDGQPRVSEEVALRLAGVPVNVGSDEVEPSTTAVLDFVDWYQVLRSSESLVVQLDGSAVDPVVFDLTRVFSTSLQDELDACAASFGGYPGASSEAWTAGAKESEHSIWATVTNQAGVSAFVHANLSVGDSNVAPSGVTLSIVCGDRGLWISVINVPLQEATRGDLTISHSGQSEEIEDVYLGQNSAYDQLSGKRVRLTKVDLDDSWYERLRDAETVTLSLEATSVEHATFDLTRLFSLPLQPELDECARDATSVAASS